jgi:hypothetical protein
VDVPENRFRTRYSFSHLKAAEQALIAPLQMPQSRTPPQRSGGVPQLAPMLSHVVGEQPQLFAKPPPPHVLGGVQVPQCSVPPHPLGASPQLMLRFAHVLGTH